MSTRRLDRPDCLHWNLSPELTGIATRVTRLENFYAMGAGPGDNASYEPNGLVSEPIGRHIMFVTTTVYMRSLWAFRSSGNLGSI